jgi:hypothetical protein
VLNGCHITRFIALLRRGERGQALIFFVGGITLIMGMAALAIDVGLWYSDRAVARKDADAAAESAAPLYDPAIPPTFVDARNVALGVAASNGATSGVNVLPADCLGEPETAIRVEVQRESRLVFGGVFPGIDAPNTPGIATACVASVGGMDELRPIAVTLSYDVPGAVGPQSCLTAGGIPRFGTGCRLYLRQPGTGNGFQRVIDVDNGSAAGCSEVAGSIGAVDDKVRDGSNEACAYLGTVYRVGASVDIDSIEDRLDEVQEGLGDFNGILTRNDCDGSDPGGIEEFDEVFRSPDGGPPVPNEVVVLSCIDADRLVYLPVVPTLPGGGSAGGRTIQGFMPFFITGCIVFEDSGPDFSAECDEDPDNPPDDPLEGFAVTGIPVKLQEPLVNGVDVKGFDTYGTYRSFLYED